MKSFWDLLKSMKTAIVVLLIITICSAIGALIPQNAPYELYIQRFGEVLGRVIITFQTNDLYHSWWFLAIMILLAVNLTVCSITHLGTFWKAAFGKNKLKDQKSFPEATAVKLPNAPKIESIQALLKRKGFRLKESGENSWYFAKGGIGRLGALIIHMGFLSILIGSVIGNQSGISHYQNAEVGDTIIIPTKISAHPASQAVSFKIRDAILKAIGKTPPEDFDFQVLQHSNWTTYTDSALFKVVVDSIAADFTPQGQPSEYLTVASVIEDGEIKLSHRIEVNHPLSYKGFLFYQNNWGHSATSFDSALITVEMKMDTSSFSKDIWIHPNERLSLGESGLAIEAMQFVADFVIDEETKEITTRSNEPRNPAIKIALYSADTLVNTQWSFMLHPDFHGRNEELNFTFADYVSTQFTGLEINKHAGINLVWLGFILMSLGLMLAFYVIHREIWIYWDSDSNQLYLMGRSNKFKSSLDEELHEFRNVIRRGE